ncbi:Lrp/AsnC family transcriptional regulator [Sphingomonas daechungensis]|uniref:Lrp/AsnC family transcriptional regulator n=1 Tax=Sphingomonas daechungensis TaxID=1176646 RepID=A0ABX6T2W8_9SPHN|nr:Lrp/AsnC family transcriptional regulator [Sphingomonas daechungensis]QNP43884.1 Lrp/AsnC family transcriptional regulator [Sphingomonas daechungensis]
MLDRFDISLLNLVQRDDGQTAEVLANNVPLSPSAIARRLRRLRANGIIARTIALLSPRLVERRLRALVLIQLSEHADLKGKDALEKRLLEAPCVQFCYEIAGPTTSLLYSTAKACRPSTTPRTNCWCPLPRSVATKRTS